METKSTCEVPGKVWKHHPLSGSTYGQLGWGGQTDKIYDNFYFQSSGYFTELVQLLLEKGVVKCVKTLQVFCLIDSS